MFWTIVANVKVSRGELPGGDSSDSLEMERPELLNEVRKKINTKGKNIKWLPMESLKVVSSIPSIDDFLSSFCQMKIKGILVKVSLKHFSWLLLLRR